MIQEMIIRYSLNRKLETTWLATIIRVIYFLNTSILNSSFIAPKDIYLRAVLHTIWLSVCAFCKVGKVHWEGKGGKREQACTSSANFLDTSNSRIFFLINGNQKWVHE